MSRTPHELRYECLRLAKDFLTENYYTARDEATQKFERDQAVDPNAKFEFNHAFPTLDSILATSTTFKLFIDRP